MLPGPDRSGTTAVGIRSSGRSSRARNARANRSLVGTVVAAVAEVGRGVRGGDAVERGAERLMQGVLVARGHPAQLGLDLRPGGLDRAQVRRIGRQVAVGETRTVQQLAYP